MLWKRVALHVLSLVLLLSLTACSSLHTLTDTTMPQRGWSAFQVEAALGPSSQKTFNTQPPVQIWRYGVSAAAMGFGPLMVLPRCDSLSTTCLSVTLPNLS
jgi:hypothetical protein